MQLLIDGKCWKIQPKAPIGWSFFPCFSRPRSYVIDDITVASSSSRTTQGFSNSSTTAKYTSSHGNGKSYSYETDNTNLLLVPSALRDKGKKPRYELWRLMKLLYKLKQNLLLLNSLPPASASMNYAPPDMHSQYSRSSSFRGNSSVNQVESSIYGTLPRTTRPGSSYATLPSSRRTRCLHRIRVKTKLTFIALVPAAEVVSWNQSTSVSVPTLPSLLKMTTHPGPPPLALTWHPLCSTGNLSVRWLLPTLAIWRLLVDADGEYNVQTITIIP